MNAFIQLKSDSKKLQFGPKKCKKLHIGKYCVKYKCDTLEVDSWTEVQIINDETGISEIEDNCEGKEIMEERTDEKYLGVLRDFSPPVNRLYGGRRYASRVAKIK